MHNNDLQPCPFCGSKDVEFTDDWEEDGVRNMTVYCNNCRAMLRPTEVPCDDNGDCYSEGDDDYDEAYEDTIKDWNARSSSGEHADDVLTLARGLFDKLSKLSNLNLPSEFMSDMTKLSDKLHDLEDQIRREKTKVVVDRNTPEERPEVCAEERPEVRAEENSGNTRGLRITTAEDLAGGITSVREDTGSTATITASRPRSDDLLAREELESIIHEAMARVATSTGPNMVRENPSPMPPWVRHVRPSEDPLCGIDFATAGASEGNTACLTIPRNSTIVIPADNAGVSNANSERPAHLIRPVPAVEPAPDPDPF